MGQFKSSRDLQKVVDQKQKVKKVRHIRRAKQNLGQVDEFIILDKNFNPKLPDCGLPAVLEHSKVETDQMYNGNGMSFTIKQDIWQQCAGASGESCPVCDGRVTKVYGGTENSNNPQVNIYLTVLQLAPKRKNGTPIMNKEGVPYPAIKYLLPLRSGVDNSNLNTILDTLQDAYIQKHPKTGKPLNTIYGVKLKLKRGTDKMSPIIGEPVRYDAVGEQSVGDKFKRVSRKWLVENFGHEARTDDNGKVYAEKDSYIEPYDYEKVFAEVGEQGICEKYGVPYTPPAAQNDNAMYDEPEDTGFDDVEFDDDDIPFDAGETSEPVKEELSEKEVSELDDELGDLDFDEEFDK